MDDALSKRSDEVGEDELGDVEVARVARLATHPVHDLDAGDVPSSVCQKKSAQYSTMMLTKAQKDSHDTVRVLGLWHSTPGVPTHENAPSPPTIT